MRPRPRLSAVTQCEPSQKAFRFSSDLYCSACISQQTRKLYTISHQGSATLSNVDIDSSFELDKSSIEAYRRNGFVKIPAVFDEPTMAHYGPAMSLEVAEADKTPLQQDPDYQQAFTQVSPTLADVACHYLHSSAEPIACATFVKDAVTLTAVVVDCEVQNLWRKNNKVLEFIKGQRLGRIAAELMGVSSLQRCMKHLLSLEQFVTAMPMQ